MGKAISGYVVSARHMNPVPSTAAAAAAKPLNLVNFTASSKAANAFPLESFKRPVWGSSAGGTNKLTRYYNFLGERINKVTTTSPSTRARARAGDVDDAFDFVHSLDLAELELEPATAKLVIAFLGPFLSVFAFLFVIRIVMSWYPKLPVGKFPYVIAYAPTEPLLIPTRKLIPPLGGVDVTPVVWFGFLSFLNEILLGPQGLLVLISQQL